MIDVVVKTCSKCGEQKEIGRYRNVLSHGKPYTFAQCRDCERAWRVAHPEVWRRSTRKYRAEHPERCRANLRAYRERNRASIRANARANDLRYKYNLTLEQYAEMHKVQGGACAICGYPESRLRLGKLLPLVVDHDHKTGRIRGLLCCDCNTSIGKMKDNPEILRAAASYIERM